MDDDPALGARLPVGINHTPPTAEPRASRLTEDGSVTRASSDRESSISFGRNLVKK